MEIKKGIGVSPGVVISTAIVIDAEDLVIPKRNIGPEALPAEIDRLGRSIESTIVDLQKLRDDVTNQHGKEIGGIFDFHIGILRDKSLRNQIVAEIEKNASTAEYAV